MNKILKRLVRLVVVVSIASTNPAVAQKIRGIIDGGQIRGIPTAIVPFKIVDGLELDTQIDLVVAADLNASGKFESIEAAAFMSMPSRPEEVRFKDWRFVDAEVLVIGEVWKLDKDKYEVQFHIYDVAREQQIGTGKRIPNLRERDLRTVAHIISDSVYQAFTGRPGAFHSRIAYIKRSEIEHQRYRYRLIVADWDGYNEKELFASWQPLLSPSWSPDSKKIAFVSFTPKGPVVKVIDRLTGRHETIASYKGVNSAPAWSPDGTKIAYATSKNGSPDVYIYDVATKQHERVTTHYAIDTEPAWSPDGKSLLFTSSRTGKAQIYTHVIGSDSSTRATFEGKDNANASYDFEGKRVVMVHEGGQIVVMQAKTGQLTWLTNAKFDESPSFSPNGDMVLYAAEYDFQPALVVASSDGRVRTRVEFVKGDVREPAWSSLR